MPLCTLCAHPTQHLYTTYSSKSNIRLGVCAKCGRFMDPLIEHPPLLLLLDLVLLKPRVYLHLLFNRGHPPKDGRPASKTSPPESNNTPPGIWTDWARLVVITIAAESASRLVANSPGPVVDGFEVLITLIIVLLESIAQHVTTTLVALGTLKLRGWRRRSGDIDIKTDGRQKHFRPIMISLTLFYSTILPLLLQLVLGIWRPTVILLDHDQPIELTTIAYLLERLPESSKETVLVAANEVVELWRRTDLVWAGTRLLGGMSAAFGLRVILPTRPIETTMIVLAGWVAADLTSRLVSHFVACMT